MRTWLRVALATGSLLIAAWLAGCAAAGTPQPAGSASGGVVTTAPGTSPPGTPETTGGGTGAPPPPAGSGVTGLITVDGGCPVITDKGCPDRPYPGRITVTMPGSTTAMASLLAGTDGTYRLALAPGTYLLHVANPEGKPFPRPATVTVVVQPGRYATANVRLDSGIR